MSQRQRVNVTLPEEVHRALTEWAESEDRTLANLLAHLASKAARDCQDRYSKGPIPISGVAAESAGTWKADESITE